jgi:hypothetical protein
MTDESQTAVSEVNILLLADGWISS